MTPWFRIFGTQETPPQPAALLEHLQQRGYDVSGHFQGDDLGWFHASLLVDEAPCTLERYLATEDGIRAELNTWAAWLETIEHNPAVDPLMRHMIGARQLFTLHGDDSDDDVDIAACLLLCRFLARSTAGVYQIDHQGFHAADGTLLVPE